MKFLKFTLLTLFLGLSLQAIAGGNATKKTPKPLIERQQEEEQPGGTAGRIPASPPPETTPKPTLTPQQLEIVHEKNVELRRMMDDLNKALARVNKKYEHLRELIKNNKTDITCLEADDIKMDISKVNTLLEKTDNVDKREEIQARLKTYERTLAEVQEKIKQLNIPC